MDTVQFQEIIFGALLSIISYFLFRLIGKFDTLNKSVNLLHSDLKSEMVKRENDSEKIEDQGKSLHKLNGRVMVIENKITKIETVMEMDQQH